MCTNFLLQSPARTASSSYIDVMLKAPTTTNALQKVKLARERYDDVVKLKVKGRLIAELAPLA